MMDILHGVLNNLSLLLNIIGVLVIIWGVVISMSQFLRKEVMDRSKAVQLNEVIRICLGSYLVLGLEFFIAGDVIKTVITPTWDSLGILGTIVVIRTVLSYFLTKDSKKV
jgi:uncharacterized membrane protein